MGKLTKEKIEQTLQEIYGKEEWIQRCEWEEDGERYSAWKVTAGNRTMYTNDAGIKQIYQAMRKELENYNTDGKAKKGNKRW